MSTYGNFFERASTSLAFYTSLQADRPTSATPPHDLGDMTEGSEQILPQFCGNFPVSFGVDEPKSPEFPSDDQYCPFEFENEEFPPLEDYDTPALGNMSEAHSNMKSQEQPRSSFGSPGLEISEGAKDAGEVPQLMPSSQLPSPFTTPGIQTPLYAQSRFTTPANLLHTHQAELKLPVATSSTDARYGGSREGKPAIVKFEPLSPILPPTATLDAHTPSTSATPSGAHEPCSSRATHASFSTRAARGSKKAPAAATRTTTKRRSTKGQGLPCTYADCEATFYDKSTRKRHITRKHLNVGFTCPGCHERLSREDSLKRHILTRRDDSVCQVEARKLGFDPKVWGSIKTMLGMPLPRRRVRRANA